MARPFAGEVQWVVKSLLPKHEEAAAKGVKLVPCCGTDSVPADISTWLAARELRERHQQQTAKVVAVVTKFKGGASGGTLASAVTMFDSPWGLLWQAA